jgi:hypothetical protein
MGLAPALAISARGTPTAIVVSSDSPSDRLWDYIKQGSRRGFIDARLRKLSFKIRLSRLKGGPVLGYIAKGEYWIPDDRFKKVAEGSREAAALKEHLLSDGRLETGNRGQNLSYVVKRPLPDGRRPYFVVVRRRAKRP